VRVVKFPAGGWRGLVEKALAVLALAVLCCGYARSAQAAEPFFMQQTGGFFHYVRESSTKFSDIKAKIESGYYASRGVRNLIFYCPYSATDEFRGVPAVDHFATNANTGTVEDFGAMVVAAHARGMAVSAYMGLLFVDPTNAIWVKAQKDHEAGTHSTEEKIFRWAAQDSDDAQEYGGWDYSDAAGSYYATSWERPAIDLDRAEGRAYVESVLEFWMDLGVDGFEYDSIESFWGGTPEILKDVLVTYPNGYSTGQKYLIREGPTASFDNEEENDLIGLTHILLSGDTDDRSVATDVMDGSMTVDDLEEHFAKYLDARRKVGHGAKAVSHYRDDTPAERALDAAVLAGNGAVMEIDFDQNYSALDQAHQQQYDAVFVGLARSSAEAPGASRKRVPATPDTAYAIVRQSVDGAERALNVYNFAKQPAMVKVDLSDTGIVAGDAPVDLVTDKPATAVAGNQYTVSLPASGYALLGFSETTNTGGSPDVPDPDAGTGGASTAGQGGRSPSTGGASTAGQGGKSPSTGGASAQGGSPSAGAPEGGDAGTKSPVAAPSSDRGGCGCTTVPRSGGKITALMLALALAANIARRRRSQSRAHAPTERCRLTGSPR
jgi:MYXO-CTERM domain-containing protein